MTLGERLLDLRKKSNFSQEEVAEKLNVTRQTISKWETNQSTPDFDKIIPICNLYKITTEELLTGEKRETSLSSTKKVEIKRKNTKLLIIGIFLYFLSIIWIIIGEETLDINDGLVVSGFLFICAIATCIVVYYGCNLPKKEELEKQLTQKEKIRNSVIEITLIIFCCLYFIISFITMAWNVTWIMWLIYAVVEQIIKITFELRGEKDEYK